MTIAEAENFYEQDEKKYNIENNKDFLVWFKNKLDSDYVPYLETDEIQSLIENIVNWYELKYPNKELETEEGVTYFDYKDLESLSSYMSTKQLLFRLSNRKAATLNCPYHASGWCAFPIYDDGTNVADKASTACICLERKNWTYDDYFIKDLKRRIFISASTKTGLVYADRDLEEYVDKGYIQVEDLYKVLKEKVDDEFELDELERCVTNHKTDLELRDKILQLTALNLLYSENTIPEYGYKRAKRFIKEFNEDFGLNLTTYEIDEIMNRDYKQNFDEDFEEEIKISSKTAEKEPKFIKKLIKSIFKN